MIAIIKDSMHKKLKDQLLLQVKKSNINDRLPSERALAKDHGVCRATVVKVMAELELEGYITRRPGKGTFVAPLDKTVHCESSKKTSVKGEVIIAYPDFYSYMIWEKVHISEFMALQHNLSLINLKLQRESKLETIFDIVKGCHNLQGIILIASAGSMQILQQLDSLKIPVVFLQYIASKNIGAVDGFENIYEVTDDHHKSGYIKMNHLLQNGHREIAYIRNEPKSLATQISLAGIKQALYDNGCLLKDLVISEPAPVWGDPKAAGYTLTAEMLDKHDLTALLYDTLPGNIGGARALYERNLKCPDDISIISSCPDTEFDNRACPVICSAVTSNEKQIKKAMDIIIRPETVHGKKILLDINIKEGESIKDLKHKGSR